VGGFKRWKVKSYLIFFGLPMESLELLTMFMDGITKKEIAMGMGISASALSQRLSVLKKGIKECL
jgi:hypothetical protein